jgi:prefoldin beta subunit
MESKNNSLEQIQFLEQTLQTILYQKQAFELELSETESSLEEIEKSKGDAFKIVGQIMIKTDSTKIKDELINKIKIIKLRSEHLSKQELSIVEKIEKLREELVK